MLSRLLSVDSYSAADPNNDRPTGIDVLSTGLGVGAAVSLAGQVAADLDIDAEELHDWSAEVQTSETSDAVQTDVMQSRIGYVLAQLRVTRLGMSSYVHMTLSWSA